MKELQTALEEVRDQKQQEEIRRQLARLRDQQQQMLAAETGYRRSGYSRSWLTGQWPTAWPCLSFT